MNCQISKFRERWHRIDGEEMQVPALIGDHVDPAGGVRTGLHGDK
jgi:hypothetical protein